MGWDGHWVDDDPTNGWLFFLCQGMYVAFSDQSASTSIEVQKEQLAFFPFHLTFKKNAIKQIDDDQWTSGFTLNWFLRDRNGTQLTEMLPAREQDWKQTVPTPEYQQPLLQELVKLARDLQLQNMKREQILKEVILQKSQLSIIPKIDDMCSLGQVKADKQAGVYSKLVFNVNTSNTQPSDEDIEAGYERFHAVIFCPAMTLKMYDFIDHLLSNETSRTIIQTIVHLFQSGTIPDEEGFKLAKQFYSVFTSTLDLQYGNILLAASTTAQLQECLRNNCPFLTNNTNAVYKCFQESKCDIDSNIHLNRGKSHISIIYRIYYRWRQLFK